MTDIVGYGDKSRDDHDRLFLRSALAEMLRKSFVDSGLPWQECRHHDLGDGLLTILPPTLPTTLLVDPLLRVLDEELHQHNRGVDARRRIRLRSALHVGPVVHHGTGYPSASVIHAARMLDSGPLRRSFAATGTPLALMVSGFVYESVIRNLCSDSVGSAFRRTRCRVKNTSITGWIYLARAAHGEAAVDGVQR